jgi:hypothetical protein
LKRCAPKTRSPAKAAEVLTPGMYPNPDATSSAKNHCFVRVCASIAEELSLSLSFSVHLESRL